MSCFFFRRLYPPPSSPLFPYTTLFRSVHADRSPSVTTSVCPSNAKVGPGPPPPSTTATTLGRPGAASVVVGDQPDRKSTRLNSSHVAISYAVFGLKKKTTKHESGAGGA